MYATYAWLRHIHDETTTYDLGIFDQAIRAYSRFETPLRVLPEIPDDQCVEAANQLGPHLTARDYITQPTRSGGRATWVVLDMSQVDSGWQTPPPNGALAQTMKAGYTSSTSTTRSSCCTGAGRCSRSA